MFGEILELIREARKLSQAEFVASYPDPVLVIDPFRPVDEEGFGTWMGEGGEGENAITVVPVRKRRNANSFMNMITVGRAANNDVELSAQGVSKFHAFFTQEDGAVFLADAGSTYGTFVDDKQLAGRQKHPLEPGVKIRFGPVQARFHTSSSFFDYLHRIKGLLRD